MKWYKRDAKEALDGMLLLSLEERGAYNTILDMIYFTDDKLVDDDRFLAGHMRCDLRVWKRIKQRLVDAGKIVLEAGCIRNIRATSTLKEAASLSEVNGKNGRKSGVARRKNKDLEPAIVQQKPNHKDIDIERGGANAPLAREVEPPGAGALRAEADARRAQAKRWPEFRATYPKREGSQSWPAAEKKYIALVASGVAEQTIIDGAHRYSDSLRASGSLGTRFVKHASAWLNQKGWEDEYLAGTGTGRRSGSDLMDAFDNRIREAEDRAGHRAPGEGNGDWAGTIDATFTEI